MIGERMKSFPPFNFWCFCKMNCMLSKYMQNMQLQAEDICKIENRKARKPAYEESWFG